MIAYPNEQLEMVMDAHNKAFEFFSGVCRKGIYDNMKTAVKTVLLGKQREFNKRFLQMCSHHLFEPIACTPASGWEKGQVENQVNTGRLNFFTPLISVASLEELNILLEKNCIAWAKNHLHPEQKEKTVFDMYQEEMHALIPYRRSFDSYKLENQVLSPYSFIQYATNCYSAECAYVGKPVEIRIYAKEIVIYYRNKMIGHHKRSFERYKRIYDPWHYVPLLERKPGALRNGAPFKQMRFPNSIQKVREHLSAYPDGHRRFIRILLAVMLFLITLEGSIFHANKGVKIQRQLTACVLGYVSENDAQKFSQGLFYLQAPDNPEPLKHSLIKRDGHNFYDALKKPSNSFHNLDSSHVNIINGFCGNSCPNAVSLLQMAEDVEKLISNKNLKLGELMQQHSQSQTPGCSIL